MPIITGTTASDALVTLTAAVEGHAAGGELRAGLQSDWSECDVPTITVRIGNHVTVRQAATYHEAAEALLGWVGSLAVDIASPSLSPTGSRL